MYLIMRIPLDNEKARTKMENAASIQVNLSKLDSGYMLLRSPLLHSEDPDDMVIHRKSLFTGLFSEAWQDARIDIDNARKDLRA